MATDTEDRNRVGKAVNEFYSLMPFNLQQSADQASHLIRERNEVKGTYPALDALLRSSKSGTLLDVGCGIGWFVNTVAYHYGREVVGLDQCREALDWAESVTRNLSIERRVKYVCADLFDARATRLSETNRFRIVNSLGVLHHTYDCRRALMGIVPMVEEGGFLHLGLYHAYGRRPFLELFQPYLEERAAARSDSARSEIEERAFQVYRRLNSNVKDETSLRSWFRDQVLHPHETQHTLKETVQWIQESGLQCVATSINRFEPVESWDALFEEEKKMESLSYQRNHVEKRYFPGFFVVLAQRPVRGGSGSTGL